MNNENRALPRALHNKLPWFKSESSKIWEEMSASGLTQEHIEGCGLYVQKGPVGVFTIIYPAKCFHSNWRGFH
jgi:hypothetical protein